MDNGDSESEDSVYVVVSFIERAPRRRKVLSLLCGDDVYTPSELADETEMIRQNVSRVLGELKEKELVNCLNPNATKYRYYEATDKGKEINELINER